jgi:hypothetical protein
MVMRSRSDQLATFARLYVEALTELEPADLPRAPCLGYGRGGVAHVLHRAGVAEHRRELLDHAAAWALAGIRTANAFQLRGWPKASYSRGLAGLQAITAIIADARGDHAKRQRAITRFIDVNRRARGSIDLFQGTAGRLAGTAILQRACPDPRLAALGDELAATLRRALRRRTAAGVLPTGIAHGWPGVVLGLIEWERIRPSAAPDALELRAHLVAQRAHEPPGGASWAHGHGGMALLWARGFEVFADERFRTWGREAGELAFTHASDSIMLTSGAPGVAFALLALADVEPDGPWRDRALVLCLRALAEVAVPPEDPYGLWSGLSGLYCLVTDLLGPSRGFPILEA